MRSMGKLTLAALAGLCLLATPSARADLLAPGWNLEFNTPVAGADANLPVPVSVFTANVESAQYTPGAATDPYDAAIGAVPAGDMIYAYIVTNLAGNDTLDFLSVFS